MPMSRLPRRFWLGSSTSPPLMRRANLSSGPMAPLAGRPAAATKANEPAVERKLRRDDADIVSPLAIHAHQHDSALPTVAIWIARASATVGHRPPEGVGTARSRLVPGHAVAPHIIRFRNLGLAA